MNATLERKLARIKLYATRYELTASHPDGRRYLIAYTPRKNRQGLFACLADDKRSKLIVAITGSESIHFGKRAVDGGTMGEWTVRFSGRTQRECYIEGELPYVGDVINEPTNREN